MRLLFQIDTKDYDPQGTAFIHHSARCIHIRGGLAAMVHSAKYDYYVFPGGGIREGESPEEALMREAQEEAGLVVIPESIKGYGFVRQIQKSSRADADYFLHNNAYYFCDVKKAVRPQNLDAYEAEEGFALEYVPPDQAIFINRNADHGPKEQLMLEREARVLELLKKEGYFNESSASQQRG